MDGEDRTRHRGDELDGPAGMRWPPARAARVTSGGGAIRNGTLRPGDVDMDRVADDDKRQRGVDGAAAATTVRCSAVRLEADGARRVEPPAARHGSAAQRCRGFQPARRPPTPMHPSGIAVRSAQSSGGQIRSSVSMRASPSRTTGSRTSQRRKRRFVVEPEDDRVVERRRQAVQRLARGPRRGR